MFALYLVTGFRKMELSDLERWQVIPFLKAVPKRIAIRKRLHSAVGAAKNARSGTKFAGEAPTEVFIFGEVRENLSSNKFDLLLEYMALRDCIELAGDLNKRFLLAVNHSALS